MTRWTASTVEDVAEIATRHAESVDREGRFPIEAVSALRSAQLLGVVLLTSPNAQENALKVASSACCTLGRACGATGLIYAMHLSQLACLESAALSSTWHSAFLRDARRQQYLIASVTSEAGVGGDIRTSSCALDVTGDLFDLRKEAPTASYVTHADALVITARRNAAAVSSDQALVVVPRGSFEIEELRRWDTLGMRGTCSGGFSLHARGHVNQVCLESFSTIAEQVMVPVCHVLWGSVWLGIAAMSIDRARNSLAAKARGATIENISVQTTGGMLRLERAAADLRTMESRLLTAIEDVSQQLVGATSGRSPSIAARVSINALKVTLSELAVSIVLDCLKVCGSEGYRNDGPFSLTRQLRDVLSAPLMVNNDRVAASNSHLALIQKSLSTVL